MEKILEGIKSVEASLTKLTGQIRDIVSAVEHPSSGLSVDQVRALRDRCTQFIEITLEQKGEILRLLMAIATALKTPTFLCKDGTKVKLWTTNVLKIQIPLEDPRVMSIKSVAEQPELWLDIYTGFFLQIKTRLQLIALELKQAPELLARAKLFMEEMINLINSLQG